MRRFLSTFCLALTTICLLLTDSASSMSRDAWRKYFDIIDFDKDTQISYLDIAACQKEYDWSPPDSRTIEEIVSAAKFYDHKLFGVINTLSYEEFEAEMKKLDPDDKKLAEMNGSPDPDNLIEYMRKIETNLAKQSDRPRCKPGFFRSGDWCYLPLIYGRTYASAMQECNARGGDLAVIEDPKTFKELESILDTKNAMQGAKAAWMHLRFMSQMGQPEKWIWEDEYPLESMIKGPCKFNCPTASSCQMNAMAIYSCCTNAITDVARWLPGEPNGQSEVQPESTENVTCGVVNFGENRGWSDESCDTKTLDLVTLCQARPDVVDVTISILNHGIKPMDVSEGDFQIPDDSGVRAGKPLADIEAMNALLKQLNSNVMARESMNAKHNEDEDPPFVHDVFPDPACLENRVRNTQCAPQQGRRKKRGCSDRRKRAGLLIKNVGWPNKPTIRFAWGKKAYFHNTTKQNALDAMEYYSSRTCVNFEEVDPHATTPQVYIERLLGCWSSVGRDTRQIQAQGLGGAAGNEDRPQLLSLGQGCDTFYVAAHEIGHLLGLDHEQAREDRSNYVLIRSENIHHDYLFNFDVCDECCEDVGYPYDYGSIMHYKYTEFGKKDGMEAMFDTTKGQIYKDTMGTTWFPSFRDVWQINNALCEGVCPPSEDPTQDEYCKNSGYRNPRNCDVCNCPDGFGGDTCDEIEPGGGTAGECGAVLEAGEQPVEFSTPGFPRLFFKRQRCSWLIKAPESYVIELQFVSNPFAMPTDCRFGNVQVKWKEDLTQYGPQYCGRVGPPIIVSESNKMMVLLRINTNVESPIRGFSAQVRAVNPVPEPGPQFP